MYLQPQQGSKNIREARRRLAELTAADHATVITTSSIAKAILVPIPKHNPWHKGQVWAARAKTRRDFQQAVILAFGGSGHAH